MPLFLRLEVTRDEELGVYVVTSPDLRGLVVDAANIEDLHRDVRDCVDMLMAELMKRPPKNRPATAWPGDFLPA